MRFMSQRDIRKHDLPNARGEMLEWLKRHAWKACKRQKCFRGSNPRLSAKILRRSGEESSLTDTDRCKKTLTVNIINTNNY